MKTKQKIYIAGKIGDLPINEVRNKFRKAHKSIEAAGFDAISPLENGLPFESEWGQHMRKDISMLCECEAIFLLNDWIDSPGARFEVEISLRLGIPAYVTGGFESHAAYFAFSRILNVPVQEFKPKFDE